MRIPVIPGVNDSDENLLQAGAFVAGLGGVREIHLLPYHKAGVEKYRRLGRRYELPGVETTSHEAMARIAEGMRVFGKPIKIGG